MWGSESAYNQGAKVTLLRGTPTCSWALLLRQRRRVGCASKPMGMHSGKLRRDLGGGGGRLGLCELRLSHARSQLDGELPLHDAPIATDAHNAAADKQSFFTSGLKDNHRYRIGSPAAPVCDEDTSGGIAMLARRFRKQPPLDQIIDGH